MYGRDWELLNEVFAPIYSPSTAIALDLLGYTGTSWNSPPGSMLEIGCGTGLIAVTAALHGCERVVAADVNPQAVRNAALNAARQGVAGTVRAVESDLFDGLGDERFELVFWSSNYVLAPDGYEYRNPHERAYVDPGYATHRRFLREAPSRLTAEGRVLLHFSSRGDQELLERIAKENDRELRVAGRREVREGDHLVEHVLLDVIPT
ncbi:methyltransferase [Microbispora sp. NPDC049633]|uniref:methyltransferase n=1 Tax=Microbispora sp. NPDC049633 TaxID=3154355 RepID=UPI003435ACF8